MFSKLSTFFTKVSYFKEVKLALPDAIFGVDLAFKKDLHKSKINLSVGAYRDDSGRPYLFKSVQNAQKWIFSQNMDKEYLPIDGSKQFNLLSQKLTLGTDNPAILQGRVSTIQTISGTGALCLGFHFLRQYVRPQFVLLSDPTWLNHQNIIDYAGIRWQSYPYFLPATNGFDLKGMLKKLQQAKQGTVVLLQVCAHNPTGVDPKQEEWKAIADVMKKKKLFPFFDNAYQGYATGDIIRDRWVITFFLQQGFQMLIAQSFSKNMGLYGQRIGALHTITNDPQSALNVTSQMKILIRKLYSNPPMHGALIVNRMLGDEGSREEWQRELNDVVAARIIKMRAMLRSKLEQINTPGNWQHITNQIGMFSYTGLSVKQCETLVNKYHIYLLKNGRISVAGITQSNIQYLAQSIKNAILQNP